MRTPFFFFFACHFYENTESFLGLTIGISTGKSLKSHQEKSGKVTLPHLLSKKKKIFLLCPWLRVFLIIRDRDKSKKKSWVALFPADNFICIHEERSSFWDSFPSKFLRNNFYLKVGLYHCVLFWKLFVDKQSLNNRGRQKQQSA